MNDLAVQVPQAASRSYGCAPRGGHAISVTVPREAPAPGLFHNRTPPLASAVHGVMYLIHAETGRGCAKPGPMGRR